MLLKSRKLLLFPKVGYVSIIEENFPDYLDCPNDPKIDIHVGISAQELLCGKRSYTVIFECLNIKE